MRSALVAGAGGSSTAPRGGRSKSDAARAETSHFMVAACR